MSHRQSLQLIGICVTALLILAACSDAGGSSARDATQATSSPASEPTGTPAATSPPVPTATNLPATSPLVIGTPDTSEPITREQPTGPVSTQAPPTAVESEFDSDGDGFYTFDELEQAVAHLLPTYEWPANYQVTPELLVSGFVDFRDGGAQWEAGYEYTLVGLRHLCAWSYAWLDGYREGKTALMDESLDQLRSVALENPVFHDSLRDHLAEMFGNAALGDPAMMQQYVDNNCDRSAFSTPSPESSTPSGALPAHKAALAPTREGA